MKYNNLGNTGLKVSELCYGAMTFTGQKGWTFLGDSGQKEADELVAMSINAGVNFFDTADIYSSGASEEILGKAFGKKRKDLVLATKVGYRMHDGPNGDGCSRNRILNGCDASLKRLGTDYIDLYIIHAYDFTVPLEETMEALNDLVKAGKVRYIGCSNFTGWQIMKAMMISREHGWFKITSNQVLYNLVQRDIEHEIIPACLDQKVGITVWSPLAGGFLGGQYRKDKPWPKNTRMKKSGEHFPFDEEKGYCIIDELERIGNAHNASISQTAINYLLRKRGVNSVVIGARNKTQLADNLKAVDSQMNDEAFRRLDEMSAPSKIYPQWYYDYFRKERLPEQ